MQGGFAPIALQMSNQGVVCGEFHLSQNASDGGHVAEWETHFTPTG